MANSIAARTTGKNRTARHGRRRRKRTGWVLLLLLWLGAVMGVALFRQLATPDSRVPPSVTSHTIYMECIDDGSVVYSRNSQRKIYPASITKVMTALVALESLDDLNQPILLRADMFEELAAAGASRAGFQPGEEVAAVDLLYGLLLQSGAECAVGLAEYIAGTEAEFAALMNQKARQLGMESTHFTNATGLHNSRHTSTAQDLALLMESARQNETLWAILTATGHSCAPTSQREGGYYLQSTLLAQTGDAALGGGRILGGKTGYTPEAGRCLASFAQMEGRLYLLITCGAEGDTGHIEDALTLYASIPSL